MTTRREIDLPFAGFNTCIYRIYQEPGSIGLEPERALNPLERIGFVLSLMLAVFPLAVYAVTVAVMAINGTAPGWAGHVLGLGFAIAFLLTVGYQTLDFARHRGSTLSRDRDGSLVLRFRWSGGRERQYHLQEPASLAVLLDHAPGAITAWRNVPDGHGATRREKFTDVVQVELELHAARLSPRMLLRSREWIKWMPRYIEFYHRERDTEANLKATVDALRPLADAVRTGLGIPVEFRLAGGAVLEQLDAGAGGRLQESSP